MGVDQRAYAAHTVTQFFSMTGATEKDLSKTMEIPVVDREQNVVFPSVSCDERPPPGVYAPHASAIIGKLMWLARTGFLHLTVAVQALSREVLQWTHEVDGGMTAVDACHRWDIVSPLDKPQVA